MIYDCIIIGAGAAGLMTAIAAAKNGPGLKILLLDGQKKTGAKILMSGGTRCNVTNKEVSEKDYNSHQLMRVRNILRAFDNRQAIRFFNDLGVELVLEATQKYFPTTHSGKTVLDALVAECTKQSVEIKNEHKVLAVAVEGGIFTIKGEGFTYQTRTVALTTGGLSYPTTGSDGTGYRIAQSFGHTVLDTMPALTPLTTDDADFKKLSGISLPVVLTLFVTGKKHKTIRDDFLFTHLGFSGPAALDISRHWLAAELLQIQAAPVAEVNGAKEEQPQLFANFLPSQNTERFEVFVHKAQEQHPKKSLKNFLSGLLPERLAYALLAKAGIDGTRLLNQLAKEARRKLVMVCTHYPLAVSGVVGYSKAEVTAGGVDLAEADPKTLESKYQSGLFFAGEILDVDGRIGGFNFQWAWASGHAAGTAIAEHLERK